MGNGAVRSGAGAAVAAALLAWATAAPVVAEPLAKEACDTLKAEHAGLEANGLAETLKKGAAWGKSHLKPSQLRDVQRYIELEEQLLFRCGYARMKPLLAADPEEQEPQAARPGSDAAKPVKAAPKAPPPKRKTPSAPKAAAPESPSGTADGSTKAAPAPKPRPKPKPKVDDAYRPPAKD
ncbi:MAG: hypothetical protein SFW09_18040 [Hyphomicrobiaceae bacterium]|nr:hypothetical protein [Hyphomicrobiaceae bacterium]